MVKEKQITHYYCECPGCRFSSTRKAEVERCERRGYEGPDLEPGLVLAHGREGKLFEKTWVKDQETVLKEGVPEINFYVFTGNGKSKGHERVYDFLTVKYGTRGWTPFADDSDNNTEYGVRHEWSFGGDSFSTSSLESAVSDNCLSRTLHLVDEKDWTRLNEFLAGENARKLVEKLGQEGLLDKLYIKSPWVSKMIDKASKDYFE